MIVDYKSLLFSQALSNSHQISSTALPNNLLVQSKPIDLLGINDKTKGDYNWCAIPRTGGVENGSGFSVDVQFDPLILINAPGVSWISMSFLPVVNLVY